MAVLLRNIFQWVKRLMKIIYVFAILWSWYYDFKNVLDEFVTEGLFIGSGIKMIKK